MAAPGSLYTTGADPKADELRRRNVVQTQPQTQSNGQVKILPEQEKVKIKQQVLLPCIWAVLETNTFPGYKRDSFPR